MANGTEQQVIPITDTMRLELFFSSIRELFAAANSRTTEVTALATKLQEENQELKRKLYPEVNPEPSPTDDGAAGNGGDKPS